MGLKYRTEEEMQEIEQLTMREGVLRENFMDPESVKQLQQLYNQYLHGFDKIAVDGVWGTETEKSFKEWETTSRYFMGSDTFDINPLEISKSYLESKEEDL
tara:strand:- start:482 stop:784 length:303 start_codon:yes stop_codon:yes gene_type:complete